MSQSPLYSPSYTSFGTSVDTSFDIPFDRLLSLSMALRFLAFKLNDPSASFDAALEL